MTPEGWLREPNGKLLLRFLREPHSSQRQQQIYMDKWNVSPVGTPNKFLNRRKVELLPAIETWNELIANGWYKVDNQFSSAA